MTRELKHFSDASGTRRIVIVQRDDGLFSFIEEGLIQNYDNELAERFDDWSKSWVPRGTTLSLYQTMEEVEQTVLVMFPWIKPTK